MASNIDEVDKYIPENKGNLANWVDNIYQIARTDPVLGGSYGGPGSKLGIMNRQAIELAERTQFLKNITDDVQKTAYPKTRLSEKISAEDNYIRNIIRLLGNYGFTVPKQYTDYTNILRDYLGYTYRGQTNDIYPYFSSGVIDTYCVAINPSPSPEEQEAAKFNQEEEKGIFTKIVYWAAKVGEEGRDQPVGIAIKGNNTTSSDLVITRGFVRLKLQNHVALQEYIDSGLPKGELIYLSDQYPGQLTLTKTGTSIGICVNNDTIYLDPVGTASSGKGEVTYEDQDYASLLTNSSFSEMYYDTFQEFAIPEDAPDNFPIYNYAESCLEGNLGLDGATPTQYTVTILDSEDLEDAATYYSFGTIVYVNNVSNVMRLEYTTDKMSNPDKVWHPVENLFNATVEQEENRYNAPASQGYPLDCYMTVKPFKDLTVRFTWTGVNKLLSFAVLYGEIPVVSNTAPTMYVEYAFKDDWDGTTNRTILIPRLNEFQTELPDELANQEEYGGLSANSRPYAFKKDGKSLGVRDTKGRYLVCGVHYRELNGGIELIGYPSNPLISYNTGDKLIFFGYGGLVDASTENTVRLDNITDEDGNLVVQGRNAKGVPSGNKYRIYILEDEEAGNKLVYELIN